MRFNILSMFSGIADRYKAKNLNVLTMNDYYDRLRLLALSIFKWEGLPPSCNARFLEKTLYSYGHAIFVDDPLLGYLTLKCNPSNQYNYYDEATGYRAYGTNYTEKEFLRNECVFIRNNYLEKPTDLTIMLFASRLTEAERTIDINIKGQKTPKIIRCSDKEKATVKNIWLDYDGNEPVIVVGKGTDMENFKVFDLTAPFVADKVQSYKRDTWNECMTFLGINNNPNDQKKERMIVDELNANNQLININAQSMLLTREEACQQINDKYNLSVSVRMRTWDEIIEEKEEDQNGTIYSRATNIN